MERWNVQHRVTCVRSYYKTNSVTEVQRVYRRQFNVGRHGHIPSRNTILSWVKKFEETGSVLDVKHGAPRTVRTPENVQTLPYLNSAELTTLPTNATHLCQVTR
ncbi:hypothetical protein ACJJTC_003033 [Scirpophaga incertulas]